MDSLHRASISEGQCKGRGNMNPYFFLLCDWARNFSIQKKETCTLANLLSRIEKWG